MASKRQIYEGALSKKDLFRRNYFTLKLTFIHFDTLLYIAVLYTKRCVNSGLVFGNVIRDVLIYCCKTTGY